MIRVENLSKHFTIIKKKPGIIGALRGLFKREKELKKAVDEISFTINAGEMVGYIGANGAGKSTTIKMMTGILVPTSGSVVVGDLIPFKERQKHAKQIGVVFGQRTQLWWDLPLRETFSILKEIYQIPKAEFEKRMAFLDETLDLKDFISQAVRTLSLGQRMRADLAASLLHNPKVLFLDEPTIGLDIVVKEKIIAAIKTINKEYGTTVILTTHDMADIEELCSRIIIIDAGKKVYDGGIEEIKDRYGFMKTLSMDVRDPETAAQLPFDAHFGLNSDDLNSVVDGNTLTIRFNKQKVAPADLISWTIPRLQVQDIRIQDTPIEEIVKEIYAGKVL